MAKGDFQYIINTELKLNTGSLKKLIEDIKDVDTSIKNHFNKTGGAGIRIPVSIDKTASLNNLQSEVKRLVTAYTTHHAPTIKLKVEIDPTSANKLRADIGRLKHQLNNLDTDSKTINVNTELHTTREDRKRLADQVERIKPQITVGLRIDRNDLQTVERQIRDVQRGANTTTGNGSGARSFGEFRDSHRNGHITNEPIGNANRTTTPAPRTRRALLPSLIEMQKEVMLARKTLGNTNLTNLENELKSKKNEIKRIEEEIKEISSRKTQATVGGQKYVGTKALQQAVEDRKNELARISPDVKSMETQIAKVKNFKDLETEYLELLNTMSRSVQVGKATALNKNHPIRIMVEAKNKEVAEWEDLLDKAYAENKRFNDELQSKMDKMNSYPRGKASNLPKHHPVRSIIDKQKEWDKVIDEAYAENKAKEAERQKKIETINSYPVGKASRLPKYHPARIKAEEITDWNKMLDEAYKENQSKKDKLEGQRKKLQNFIDNTPMGKASNLPKHHPVKVKIREKQEWEKMLDEAYKENHDFDNPKPSKTIATGRASTLPKYHPVKVLVRQREEWNKMLDEAYKLNDELDNPKPSKTMARGRASTIPKYHPVRILIREQKDWQKMLDEAYKLNDEFNNPQQPKSMARGQSSNLPKHHPVKLLIAQQKDWNKMLNEAYSMNENANNFKNGMVKYGGNKEYSIVDPEMVLRNPDASLDDKNEALKLLKQSVRELAKETGQNLTRSWDYFYHAFDEDGNKILQKTRTMQYEFTKYGQEIERGDRSMGAMFRNILAYSGASFVFYEMTQGIVMAVQHMAEFEAQMARIQMIATDLTSTSGELKQGFSDWGLNNGVMSRSIVGNNARRDVYDHAKKYGMSATQNVMPVYQDVMARTELTGQDRDTTNKMVDQILKYSMITLGPGAQSDDISRVSKDMLSLYQGIYKDSDGNHMKEMDRFIDFMTLMNNSGVNTNNIMDSISELAPDAIKSGIDPRQLAGMLGAYNLSDSDASGSVMTTMAKTFLGGLGKYRQSPSIKKGLETLGIDTTKDWKQNELLEEVIRKYGEANNATREQASSDLSNLSGKGNHQGPRIQKFLDATQSSYYKDFKDNLNAEGTADRALEVYLDTLKVKFGELTQTMGESVELLAQLGALDGLKALIGGFNSLLTVTNTILDVMVKFGDITEEALGFNVSKFVFQIVALAGSIKLLTLAMGKMQIGGAVTSAIGGHLDNLRGITRGPDGKPNKPTPVNTGRGAGVGYALGGLLGWVVDGVSLKKGSRGLKEGGKNVRNQTTNVATNLLTSFGTGIKNILPALTKFGGLILRLSALGMAIGGAVWIGKTAYSAYQNKRQTTMSEQMQNFRDNYVTEGADGNDVVNAEALRGNISAWKEGNLSGKLPENWSSIQEEMKKMGIEYNTISSYRDGTSSSTVSYPVEVEEGKFEKVSFNANNDKGWSKMLDHYGAGGKVSTLLMAEAFNESLESMFEYEKEMHKIDSLTKEFNNSMNRLGYDLSKIDFNFMGAENSTGYLEARIGTIKDTMSGLGDTVTQLEEKRKMFKATASEYEQDVERFSAKITEKFMSSEELDKLTTEYKMKLETGDVEGVLAQFKTSRKEIEKNNPDMTQDQVSFELEKNDTISSYLAYLQVNSSFVNAEKKSEEQIMATNMAILEQEMALKRLNIALGIAKSGFDVINAKISQIQIAVGKAQTLFSLADDDNEKISRQLDYMKALSTELNAYRSQLVAVQKAMADLKAQNPNQDFSIEGLYNPKGGSLTEQQSIYKGLLEKHNGIHSNINSSTLAIKEQADALKEMVLNSDQYADVWERVQNRIQLVKDLNSELANIRIDSGLVPHLAQVRGAITGESTLSRKNAQYESIRDRALEGFEKLRTTLETYADDEQKMIEAYNEINKTMGSEFDSAFIQPLKDLIANDLTNAGNLINGGAIKLDEVLTYWANNITSGMLQDQISQNNQALVSGAYGGIDTNGMNVSELVKEYMKKQFPDLKVGSTQYHYISSEMKRYMTRDEMANEVEKLHAQDTLSSSVTKYRSEISRAAVKHGVDPNLIASVIQQESKFDPEAHSKADARGLMQIVPKWHPNFKGDFFNASDNIDYGTKYLKQLLDKYGGNVEKALAAYNGGSGRLDGNGGDISKMPSETRNYVPSVLGHYSGYTGLSAPSSSINSNTNTTSGNTTYVVVKGDTLSGIGSKLGINWKEIQSANGNIDPKKLQVGQSLTIPGTGTTTTPNTTGHQTGILGSSSKTQEVAQHYTSGDWYMSSKFGMRNGRMHNGVDLSLPGEADNGYKQMAFLGGEVARTGFEKGGAGNYIVIKQDDGNEQKYFHLDEAPTLKKGDKVNAGDTIGKIGNTGGSRGSHMHYEMWQNGKAVDPMKFINEWAKGEGINKGMTTPDGKEVPTPAEIIKQMFSLFKEGINAQMQINSVGALKESYTRDTDLAYGHGNIRDILGTSGRTAVMDRIVGERENVYTARYNNTQQMKELGKTRSVYVKDANEALKAGKMEEYNANKEAVTAIDKLVKTLEENNKKLAERDKYLEEQQKLDPRLNATKASEFIRGGHDKIRGLTEGSVDYYRAVSEVNGMNGQYMTNQRKNAVMSEYWSNTGQETGQYNKIKRITAQEDLNLLFHKMTQISEVLSGFSEGSQAWYVTLEDAVALQEDLHNIEQQRLQNAQRMFELTGQGLNAYVSQKAYTQSKSYVQNRDNLESAKTKLSEGGLDANKELATMQIIAGLHDQMIQQMNEYRSAVVGAFKAGALSLDEYISKMADLRDIQSEQRENAIKMVDSISQGFEQSLSQALAGGMMGNMDSTQGFIDSIKQTLATTVSSQLSNTLINNTGLQTVMTDLISSITNAATTGSPDDIANMFNGDNFGDQINNALAPFLPLIEQIVASTDGIFAIMKDQVFNAPQGFKIDSYLYDQAKGKSFDSIKNWTQNGETNEAGSSIGGVGSNTPITTPEQENPPSGVPTDVSQPPSVPTQTNDPANTAPGGTGAPDSSSDIKSPTPNTDTVKSPTPAPAPSTTTSSSYKVVKGDTLSGIGSKLGVDWKKIAELNGIKSPYTIYAGQTLKVPGGSTSSGGTTSGTTKTVSASSLNFRSKPSYNGSIIKVLPKGAKVEYLGMESGWAKVKHDGKTGYVGKSYIYHSGGIAGMMNFANASRLKSDEIQAIMQRGEVALQPKQLASLLGHSVPKAQGGSSGDMNINVTVNVEGGNYDQKGIESVVETSVDKAMTEFKRQQRLGNLSWKGTSY